MTTTCQIECGNTRQQPKIVMHVTDNNAECRRIYMTKVCLSNVM